MRCGLDCSAAGGCQGGVAAQICKGGDGVNLPRENTNLERMTRSYKMQYRSARAIGRAPTGWPANDLARTTCELFTVRALQNEMKTRGGEATHGCI